MSLAYAGHTVIYVVAEGASGLPARTAAWKLANNKDDDAPGMRVMPSNVNLHDGKSVARWLEAMRVQLAGEHVSLVIVDTVARNFVGGNESSPQDMGQFVEGCEAIRRELGTAVLFIHHTAKDGDKERGTESLRNASFAMFKVTKLEGGTAGWAATFECDRMKEATPPPPERIALRRIECPNVVDQNGQPVTSLVPEAGTRWSVSKPSDDKAQTLILGYVKKNPGRSASAVVKAVLGNGVGKTKLEEAGRALVAGGRLVKDERGRLHLAQ